MSRSLDRDEQLEAALDMLFDREKAYEDACKEFASAESEYRVQYAKEYLIASGAVEERKQTAMSKVARFLAERERTEAIRDFTKEKVRDAQLAVSARQSLLSSARRTNEAF